MEVREFIVGNPTVTAMLAEQTTQTQLPNTYLYQHLDVLMTGKAVVAGYTSAPTLYAEGVENLLQMMTVQPTKKNGAGIADQAFYATNAAYARWREAVDNGGLYVENRSTINGTTNGTYAIATSPRIDFSERGDTTSAFDSRHTNAVYLNLRWAGPEALGYGGTGGTIALNSVEVTIKARVFTGVPKALANGQPISRPYVRSVQQSVAMPNANQLAYTFQNMDKSRPLRRLFIKTIVGNQPYAEISDTPFGGNTMRPEGPHVAVRINGSDIRRETTYAQWRLANARDYRLQFPMPPGHLIYEPAAPLNLPAAQSFDVTADVQTTPTAQYNNVEFTYCQSGMTGN
jgi:hypothetical protein